MMDFMVMVVHMFFIHSCIQETDTQKLTNKHNKTNNQTHRK